jgi:serine/threonine protein kinase
MPETPPPSSFETDMTPRRPLSNTAPQLEGYRVIEEIGRGGFGVVYKAEQLALGRIVAIKAIRNVDFEDNPEQVERLLREARIVAQMGMHENIAQVYDAKQFGGLPCIIMEYVAGDSLEAKLEAAGGRLHLPRVVEVVRQVCRGLSHAHERGVIHRDVKPENVMIGANWRAKVMDFGIARAMGGTSSTKSGMLMGTPYYMSPEQWQGAKDIDHRCDIYALGVMLYHMTTGRLPFEEQDPLALGLKHISATPPRPSDVEPGLPMDIERITLRAMAKRREDRFQTARELESALKAFVEQTMTPTEMAELAKMMPGGSSEHLSTRPNMPSYASMTNVADPAAMAAEAKRAHLETIPGFETPRKNYDEPTVTELPRNLRPGKQQADRETLETQPQVTYPQPTGGRPPQQAQYRVPTSRGMVPISSPYDSGEGPGGQQRDYERQGAPPFAQTRDQPGALRPYVEDTIPPPPRTKAGSTGATRKAKKSGGLLRAFAIVLGLIVVVGAGLAGFAVAKPDQFRAALRYVDPDLKSVAFVQEAARRLVDSGQRNQAARATEAGSAANGGAALPMRPQVDARLAVRAERWNPPAEKLVLGALDFLAPDSADPAATGASFAASALAELGHAGYALAKRPALFVAMNEAGVQRDQVDRAAESPRDAAIIARATGLDLIATGSLKRYGDAWRLEVRLVDANSGAEVATEKAEAASPAAVRRALPKLVDALSRAAKAPANPS